MKPNGQDSRAEDYELILRSIAEGVHRVDVDGRITFVNPSAARLLGWGAGELQGRELHATIHHSHADGTPYPKVECPILAALRDGQVRHRDDEVFWRKDGTNLPVDYIATPMRERGVITGVVVSFRDISERRQASVRQADEFQRMTQSLARINRELDQFAYVASHDLKAPLRGIASLAQWIEEDLGGKLSAESQTHLELLRARVHRMASLIEGLVQYSRSGRVRNKVETVDVGHVLTELVEMLNPLAAASIHIAPGMPTLDTERFPLQQVFLNLLTNALKHSGRPDTRVSVRVREHGPFYEFTVEDDGQGIPAEFHAKVWEVFQTLQPRDKVEGAGLGLALVKKNVEGHGGRAWLESEEGRGAAFHFLWPRRSEGGRLCDE